MPVRRGGFTTFSVQMATSGFGTRLEHQGLVIALNISTYIILSGMSVFGTIVQGTNLEIMSLLTSNTPGRISTYIER
jgi:hypothetical protein